MKTIISKYCKTDLDVKLVFTSCKIGSFFTTKDKLGDHLISHVVYKFICAGCNTSYIGKTHRHFHVRVKEHLSEDKVSAVQQHLASSASCKNMCGEDCFSVIDRACSKYQLQIKEELHIQKESPALNRQVLPKKVYLGM